MIFEQIGPYLFWIIAGLTAGSALMVVVTQNIVRAATWLLFALGGTAGIFFLLGADFVGATQLLVYVGGTLVLVIFGVMLTAQGPFITMKTSAAEWALSITVGLSLYGVLALSAMQTAIADPLPPTVADYAPKTNLLGVAPKKKSHKKDEHGHDEGKKHHDEGEGEHQDEHDKVKPRVAATSSYADVFGRSFLGIGGGPAHKVKDPDGSERVERTAYLLPFEIVSVHLLVVLIGAAYLARAKRRKPAAQ